MVAAVALYSSSPPSAVFSSPRSSIVSDAEIDLGRRTTGNQHGSRGVCGGLSSLFASGSCKSSSHFGPSHSDGCDSLAVCSSSSFSTAQLDGGLSLSRESFDGRSTAAVNIPSATSLRLKEKSPASVLYGFGSSKNSSASPVALVGWDGSHMSSTGLPPLQRPQFPSDRQTFSLPADRPLLGGSRGPALQSIGFRLGSDGDSEAGLHLGFRTRNDEGDVAAFATSQTWSRQSEGDVAFDFTGGFVGEDGVAIEFLASPWSSCQQTGGSLLRIEKEEVQEARKQLLKLSKQANGMEALSRSSNYSKDAATLPLGDDQELLLDAQRLYPVFYDPLVKRAFNVAASAHQGQLRKDGKPYLTHCLETAIILVQCGLDKMVVAAGLLHDTLDDSMMNEQQLRNIFGDEITDLVVGVSKLSKFSQLARDNETVVNSKEAALLRNMFLAMVDFRVVLIKLADRLHNLRTLDALPYPKQQRIAKESLEIFAPLANRLGIWSWKAEMEDMCFKYLYPTEHSELIAMLEDGRGKEVVMASIKGLDAALQEAGVQIHDLSGRPKNLYSIYCKMKRKLRTVDEIYDLRGLRLIVPDVESCYKAMEVVHSLWKSAGFEHFKDYISQPKANGYQSLHMVMEGERGHKVEVQIRTSEMHHQAEFGLAAHWQYKEGDAHHSASLQQKVAWARWTLFWLAEAELREKKLRLNPADASLRPPCPFPHHQEGCPFADETGARLRGCHESDIDPLHIIVLENDAMSVRELPAGSTVADMLIQLRQGEERYSQHTIRPLVNQEFVEDLDQRLQMGDLVELAVEADELDDLEPCLPQLLPVHARAEKLYHPDLHPEVGVDEMLVEFERQRLKTWFATAR